jgi:hypothetical protein
MALVGGCGSATPAATPDASGAAGANAGANGGAGMGGASAGAGGTAGATAGSGGAGGVMDAGTADAPSSMDAPAEMAATCPADAGTSTFLAGETYGEYAVESISLMGAPCGSYTFTVSDPMGTAVALRRVGSPTVVAQADYLWRTTVSATDSTMYATFHFAGHFDVVVRKAGSGTENLYDLMLAIFDGTKVLVVP